MSKTVRGSTGLERERGGKSVHQHHRIFGRLADRDVSAQHLQRRIDRDEHGQVRAEACVAVVGLMVREEQDAAGGGGCARAREGEIERERERERAKKGEARAGESESERERAQGRDGS